MECAKCKGKLEKQKTMNSGNAKYIDYVCSSCGNKETKCEGINAL